LVRSDMVDMDNYPLSHGSVAAGKRSGAPKRRAGAPVSADGAELVVDRDRPAPERLRCPICPRQSFCGSIVRSTSLPRRVSMIDFKRLGFFPTPEEKAAEDSEMELANAQLAKLGLHPQYLFIVTGYPYGTAWLLDATGVDLDGDKHPRIVDRERADDSVSAMRRLLVRTLYRYRQLRT